MTFHSSFLTLTESALVKGFYESSWKPESILFSIKISFLCGGNLVAKLRYIHT